MVWWLPPRQLHRPPDSCGSARPCHLLGSPSPIECTFARSTEPLPREVTRHRDAGLRSPFSWALPRGCDTSFAMPGSLYKPGTVPGQEPASYEYLVLADWSRPTGRLTSGAAPRRRSGTGSKAPDSGRILIRRAGSHLPVMQ